MKLAHFVLVAMLALGSFACGGTESDDEQLSESDSALCWTNPDGTVDCVIFPDDLDPPDTDEGVGGPGGGCGRPKCVGN